MPKGGPGEVWRRTRNNGSQMGRHRWTAAERAAGGDAEQGNKGRNRAATLLDLPRPPPTTLLDMIEMQHGKKLGKGGAGKAQ
eukprot:4091712-Prymnesium_polylepis.1